MSMCIISLRILIMDDHALTLEHTYSSTYSWEPIAGPRYGLPLVVYLPLTQQTCGKLHRSDFALSQARFWMDWESIQKLDLQQLVCSTMHVTAQQFLWQLNHQHIRSVYIGHPTFK